LAKKRDLKAATTFFAMAITSNGEPARLHPMRGLKRDRTASVAIRGHAFIQNLRRGVGRQNPN